MVVRLVTQRGALGTNLNSSHVLRISCWLSENSVHCKLFKGVSRTANLSVKFA